MRAITGLLLVLAGVVGAGCSQVPTSPTRTTSATEGMAALGPTQATASTPADFAGHGWNCRTPNNGPVTVCSPPNQPLPVVAIPPAVPPPDRPVTVVLKRWLNGVFEGNVLLIRPEVYAGQRCESTGASYLWVAVLGYYECLHTVGN